jgi:hypothetical protein
MILFIIGQINISYVLSELLKESFTRQRTQRGFNWHVGLTSMKERTELSGGGFFNRVP